MEATRKTEAEDKYLSFMLYDEEYCIEILKVKEILGMMDITKVPQTPDYLIGVINLRGLIVPITDLRRKFEFPSVELSERTCIIVVEIMCNGELMLLGMTVDAINEVIGLPEEKISKVPYINAKIKSDYIIGITEIDNHVKIVLDIDKVLTEDEFVVVKNTQENSV